MYRTDDSGVTWEEKTKLLASDGAGGDEFGISVAVHYDTIVVGAHWDDNSGGTDSGERRGTVYVPTLRYIVNSSLYAMIQGLSMCIRHVIAG